MSDVYMSSASPSELNQDIKLEQFLNKMNALIDVYQGQVIPDSFGFSNLSSKALKSQINQNAYISLNHTIFYDLNKCTKKNSKKFTQIEQDFQQFRQQMKLPLTQWQFSQYEPVTELRLERMQQIIEIFLNDVCQVSEMFYSFVTLYALVATSKHPDEEFYLTISMGGDTVAPGYVEAYCIQPLSVLTQLKHLYNQGKISCLPKLALVFSHPCQVVENHRDKSGDIIAPKLHKYNSRITICRVYEFIKTFFSEIFHDCIFVEFPDYKQYSLARLFFAVSWQQIPANPQILERLFQIKGNVVDREQDTQDLFKKLIGEYNAYVSRHIFTNLKLCQAHTLRFASDRTEPQFHLAISSLYPVLRDESDKIIQIMTDVASRLRAELNLAESLSGSTLDPNSLHFELSLKKQLTFLPSTTKIHAQVGMKDMHATYYKHPEELSLQEIVTSQGYSAERLHQAGRANKAKKLEKAFSRITDVIGHNDYLNFLAQWCYQYLGKDASETEVTQNLAIQREVVEEIVLPPYETRLLLNYWLL